MVRVLICDEQVLFAEALAAVLRKRGATASAAYDLQTLLSLSDLPAASHVVVGVDTAGPPSAGAIREIRAACPDAALVCLGAEVAPLRESLEAAGADLALSKRQPLGNVVRAVLGAAGDAQDLGNFRERRLTASDRTTRPGEGRPLSARFLTTREQEVLRLLVVGESTQGIARRLGVTRATARSHVQSVLVRLAVHSRVEAVRYAVLHDLVDLHGGQDGYEQWSD